MADKIRKKQLEKDLEMAHSFTCNCENNCKCGKASTIQSIKSELEELNNG